MKCFLPLFLILIFGFGTNAQGQIKTQENKPLELVDSKNYYDLGLHIDLLVDESKKLTLQDILKPKYDGKFKKKPNEVPAFGFQKSPFLGKDNTSQQLQKAAQMAFSSTKLYPR